METPGQASVPPTSPPPCPDPDAAIIAAAARQDRDECARLLVEAHAPMLGRACMALLGSQRDAEDALLETLKEALERLPTHRNEGTLRGWLSGIARRRCARLSEARPALTASRDELDSPARTRRALMQLKPTEREVLVLSFGAELEAREVGQACGVDEATIRQRVSRGLSRLRASMSEDES